MRLSVYVTVPSYSGTGTGTNLSSFLLSLGPIVSILLSFIFDFDLSIITINIPFKFWECC